MNALEIRLWLRRLLAISGSMILVAIMVTAVTFRDELVSTPAPVSMPNSMLVQIRGDDKNAVLSFIIADQGRSWFVLPANAVLTNGVTPQTVGSVAAALDIANAPREIENSLQISLDETWVIDRLAIAAMVESVGGITISAREDITLIPPNAEQGLSLTANTPTFLNGMYASLYGVDTRRSDPTGRLRVFFEIFAPLLQKLDGGTLPEVLSAVGSTSRSSLEQRELIAVIDKLQYLDSVGQRRITILPTIWGVYEGKRGRYLTREAREQLLAAGVRETITP